MRSILLLTLIAACMPLFAQAQKAHEKPTLKSILLEQLRSTHNKAEWFVPANTAVAGLSAEQANWTDGKGNHSVGQLVTHLIFWDRRNLDKFEGKPLAKYNGNNDATFTSFNPSQWNEDVKQLDQVMTEWENAVQSADENKLQSWYSTIAHIGTHSAYHIGEIIYVRKEQGSWNPANGVK